MPDPITMLEEDHRNAEQLFERYQSSKDPKVVEEICNELTVHAIVEESLIYPAVVAQIPEVKERQPEFVQEHMEVKNAIAQIKLLGFEDPGVEPLMQTIMESVSHHVGEEEQELFPMVREQLPAELMSTLGEMAAALRKQEMNAATNAAKATRKLTGGGSSGADLDLTERTKEELYELAAEKDISGRSEMNKDELIKALQGS